MRPWDTLVVAQADRTYGATPDGVIPRPIAIYCNSFTANEAEWCDFASGDNLPPVAPLPSEATESALAAERPLFLRTLRSVFAAHIRAPERKALDPSGRPCTGRTEGLLQPAPTEAYKTVAIGREANYSHQTGVLTDPEYSGYPDISRERVWERALTILRATARTDGHTELAHELEVSESALRRYLKSGRGRTRTHARALEHAATLAHAALTRAHPGQALPTNSEALSTSQRERGDRSTRRAAPRATRHSKEGNDAGAEHAVANRAGAATWHPGIERDTLARLAASTRPF